MAFSFKGRIRILRLGSLTTRFKHQMTFILMGIMGGSENPVVVGAGLLLFNNVFHRGQYELTRGLEKLLDPKDPIASQEGRGTLLVVSRNSKATYDIKGARAVRNSCPPTLDPRVGMA